MKHNFRIGQRVSYRKRDHYYREQSFMHATVMRVHAHRIVILDDFGAKHFTKPENLSLL